MIGLLRRLSASAQLAMEVQPNTNNLGLELLLCAVLQVK